MEALLVEDDPATRQLVAALMQETGDSIIEADDGQQAWELLQAHPTPLVITDWMMPRMDGKSLIHCIREANFEQYTYVIMLTSRSAAHTTIAALEVGADDYLSKPFDPDDFLARVADGKRILSRNHELNDGRQRLARLTAYDETTHLPNRTTLLDRTRAMLSYGQRIGQPTSFALVEIDHLATLCTRYGAAVVTQLRQHVASILRQSLRSYDALGGWDEERFLLVLRATTPEEALSIAERIRLRLAATPLILADGTVIQVRASFGLTTCSPRNALPLEMLLQQAQQALVWAERAGHNQSRSFVPVRLAQPLPLQPKGRRRA